jgi:glutathione S-transferase
MPLKLYFHPLASYCWKALVGLYETGTAFEPVLVDLSNPEERARLVALWPIGKFPVLRDDAKDLTVPESTIILEYLVTHHSATLLPADPDAARETRLRDRFYDLYVHDPMQRIVGDRLRPEARRDPFGVEQARAQLESSYAIVDRQARAGRWAMGDAFTLADCAAAPALFYANKVAPLGERHADTRAYLERLMARPSFARVLEEAGPYFQHFPG